VSELQEADSGGGTGEAGEPEVEATLAVTAETPAEVAARIGGLSRIGGHRVEWFGSERLRDVYLDTAGGELRERRLALRLRRSGGSSADWQKAIRIWRKRRRSSKSWWLPTKLTYGCWRMHSGHSTSFPRRS